jgi:hypothetical protein
MAGSSHSDNLVMKKFEPSQGLKTLSVGFVAVGLLVFVIGLIKSPDRLWPAYLAAFFFVSCLGLGGLFFTTIQHVAKAGWSATIRRQSEAMASFIPWMIVGSLILAFGLKKLYPWADATLVAENPVIQAKTAFLNSNFLIVRLLFFGLGSFFFGKALIGNSLKQDQTGDESLTLKNVGIGIAHLLFFAIFFTLFSFDLLMSLMPTWYSTIFGIYCFSGLFQSSLAFLILMLMYIKRNGYVQGYYNNEHIHDVAKFLKGFTVFWAYIAFSQFMLIWYANIPEETEYYLMRAEGNWMAISLSLLILKFIVPFLALLPRGAKRNETHLTLVCVLILVMQYVDVYWMVYPNFFEGEVKFGFYEIGLLVGFMGLFLISIQKFLSKNNLVAIKDPRISEALHHHVTY